MDRMSETTNRMLRATDQHLLDVEHDARQPRLTTEADVKPDTKTRKRAEDAAAYQAKNGDSCSANRSETSQTSSTSFGMTAEPPALPRRDDVLVDKGAAAPKPCLSPVEMRTLKAIGGLLPAGTTSTAMRTIFPRPFSSWSIGENTKKSKRRTNNQLTPPPCWRRVIRTKSRQTLVFDLGGSTGRLRACPFLGRRHALRSGWARLNAVMVAEARAFLAHRRVGHHFQERTSNSLRCRFCG